MDLSGHLVNLKPTEGGNKTNPDENDHPGYAR